MPQTQPPSRISLRDVLYVIFAKLHVLIGVGLTVVVVTMVFAFLADPVYEVKSSVLVKPWIEPSLQDKTSQVITAPPVSQQDINSEIEIMNSEELLKKVVTKLGLDKTPPKEGPLGRAISALWAGFKRVLVALRLSAAADPVDAAVERLRQALKVQWVTGSNMIRVSMKGNDPEEVARTVNTFLDRYIDQHIEVHRTEGSMSFFTKQAELYTTRLKEAEAELKGFQKEHSIVDFRNQQQESLDLLKRLKQELTNVRTRIAATQSKLDTIKRSRAESGDLEGLTEEMREAPVLIELTRALLPLLVEHQRLSLLYPKNSVEVVDLERQIRETKEAIRQERERILAGNELDLAALITNEQALAAEIQRVEEEVKYLTEKEGPLARLLRDRAQYEKNMLLYQDKGEEARIVQAKEHNRVANVAVASWADVPSVPVFPKKIPLFFFALLIGPILGIAGAFASYYLDHTLKTPEDLARHGELPVLTVLGVIETSPRR